MVLCRLNTKHYSMGYGELYSMAMFYESSRGTDGGGRTVSKQEVTIKGVRKEATSKYVLPSWQILKQIVISETDGMYNCHTVFRNLIIRLINTLRLIMKCLPQMVNKEMALVNHGSIQMCTTLSFKECSVEHLDLNLK